MKQQMLSFLKEEDGVTAIEYGLIAGLIAVALLVALTSLGKDLSALFDKISEKVTSATTGTGADGG